MLQYSVNGGLPQSTPTFNNLYPGNYLVSAINIDGCSDTMSVYIANESGIYIDSISIRNASCNINNGCIQIFASGDNPNFAINTGVPQPNSTYSDLSEGTYMVVAFDPNGCTDTAFVSLQQLGNPKIKHIEVSPEHCNESDGGLQISHDAAGSLPVYFSINGSVPQLDSAFLGLKSGEYIISINDANGCFDTTHAEITLIGVPFIAYTYIMPELCKQINAEIEVIASSPFPLIYKLDSTENTTGIFTHLASGNYSIVVEDPYGCKSIKQVNVGDSSNLIIQEIITTPTGCNNEKGSIEVVGVENVEIYIEEFPGESWNSTIRELAAREYTLKLVNQVGCSLDTIVRILEECEVYMPNTFSPNGDGINDVFGAINQSFVSKWELTIFDRSGSMLYFTDNAYSGWDGTYNGKIAQVGVYAWSLVYRISSQEVDIYTFGDVTILR